MEVTVIYWRDIPSQITAGSGRKRAKHLLPERFQEAIDRAAMRGRAHDSDAYLQDWRRVEVESGNEDPAVSLRVIAERLEAEFDPDALAALVQNGGRRGPG